MSNQLFQSQDIVFLLLWLALILFVGWVWSQTYYKNSPIINYFIPALFLRLAGGIVGGIITEFYYGGIGDTRTYFTTALYIKSDFEAGVKSLNECFTFFDSTIAISEIAFPLTYLTNNSYYSITLFFSCFAFIGSWRLYKLFLYFYPHLSKQLAYCTLFLPSIFFWGSGLMKDPLSFGGLGILLYALFNAFFLRRKILLNLVIIFCSANLIYLIKPYILIAIIPASMFWLSAHYGQRIKSSVVRLYVAPVLITLGLGLAGLLTQFLTSNEENRASRYGSQYLTTNISNLQNAYTYGEQGGSYINVGEFDGSISSLITLFPVAILTTFFRPFPWEIKNVLMVFSALECLVLLYLTLLVIFKMGLFTIFRHIRSDPFLLFCLIFAVIFAGFVGSSTFNLGTLARYKIPCLPFIWLVVIILNDKVKNSSFARIRRSPSKRSLRHD